jgi:hypothetical protein
LTVSQISNITQVLENGSAIQITVEEIADEFNFKEEIPEGSNEHYSNNIST